MPADVSASSNASDCALIRNSAAISRSGTPARWRRVTSRATASASATSSGCSCHVTAGPASRWARSCTPTDLEPASSLLATAITCGVER